MLDDPTWESYRSILAILLGTKTGRESWNLRKEQGTLLPGFVDDIDAWLAEQGAN